MMQIADTLWDTSKQIFYGKKAALERGEDAVVQQVGEGKDIISILRMFLLVLYSSSLTDRSTLPVRANENASKDDQLPEDELLGQMA